MVLFKGKLLFKAACVATFLSVICILVWRPVSVLQHLTVRQGEQGQGIDSLLNHLRVENHSIDTTKELNLDEHLTMMLNHLRVENHSTDTTKEMTLDERLTMMLDKTVFVNAICSNHYRESHGMIRSLRQQMPESKIIIYDLGLNLAQKVATKKLSNVELRPFKFSQYPTHVTPRNLENYAWKPLIVQEVSREYEIVVWADTSIHFIVSLKDHIIPYLLNASLTYVGLPWKARSVNFAQFTHDGTIAYFNMTREELTELPQIQSGFGVYWMTDLVKTIVDEWADCAMHEECIAPKGASVNRKGYKGCLKKLGGLQDTKFSGCHRFDQSALDLILYKHYGKGLAETIKPVVESTCYVNRKH